MGTARSCSRGEAGADTGSAGADRALCKHFHRGNSVNKH